MTKVKIFSGSNTKSLGESVAQAYHKTSLNKTKFTRFSDGEFIVSIDETVRGTNTYVIQSTSQPTDNLFELLMMGDALKRASAKNRVAVIPYMGFARQDKKDQPRVPIGMKMVADMIETAGFTRVLAIDLHVDQIQGFFNIPVDHLSASYVFIPYVKSLNLDNLIFASPDVGGTKRAKKFADAFNTDLVICHKTRPQANIVGEMKLIGDVKGKNVIIIDDICDTAGTLSKAANLIKESGALSVRAMITHPVLSGGAYNNIEKSVLCELITTDTIPLRDEKEFVDYEKSTKKITILSVDKMLANIINKINNNESVSSIFEIKNGTDKNKKYE